MTDIDREDAFEVPSIDNQQAVETFASIRTWITYWNDDSRPFVWHKAADGILDNLAACC